MDADMVLEYLLETLTEAGAHVELYSPKNTVQPGTAWVVVDDWQFVLTPSAVDVYP